MVSERSFTVHNITVYYILCNFISCWLIYYERITILLIATVSLHATRYTVGRLSFSEYSDCTRLNGLHGQHG
jgi:hypothetical protein